MLPTRKELNTLTHRQLKKLADNLNQGGYSIVIAKTREELLNNILVAFMEAEPCSVRIKRIKTTQDVNGE